MFSFLALGKRMKISLSDLLWWSFKFCVCLGLLFKRVTWHGKEICNPGSLGMWLSSLRSPVEHANLTIHLSHPHWTPRHFTLSDTLKMSSTVSDASVVYLRAGSAYVLIWTLYAWARTFSLPSFPLQATNVGAREREILEQHHIDAAKPESRWQLMPGHWCYWSEGRKGFAWRHFQRLQRLFKESKEGEVLAVRLGKEPVCPIHCPSNTVDSKVAPVKERSWRAIGARDGQTHPMEERRLWMPLVVRIGLQPCDGFPQEAGRWNSFKACKEGEGKKKTPQTPNINQPPPPQPHQKIIPFEHCCLWLHRNSRLPSHS